MCNCYNDIKNKLRDHYQAKAPEGSTNFEVELNGYVFVITDSGGAVHRSGNEVKVHYLAPKKAGGMKKVTNKTFVRATFCPFCGVNYEEGEAQ